MSMLTFNLAPILCTSLVYIGVSQDKSFSPFPFLSTASIFVRLNSNKQLCIFLNMYLKLWWQSMQVKTENTSIELDSRYKITEH